jgi:hypothetical protein
MRFHRATGPTCALAVLMFAICGQSVLAAPADPPTGPKPEIVGGGSGAAGDDQPSIQGEIPKPPFHKTPRTPEGKPDLTGFWKPIHEAGKPTGNLGRDEPGYRLPFTEAGLKALDFNLHHTIDPEALCILGGIPRHNASGLPFEILQTKSRLATLYLYNTHRFVWLDGRKLEADPDPRYFGNAIGEWKGDTLVITSIGFKDSADGKLWGDENGNPISSQTTVVERWTRPDFEHIHLDMIVTDLKYYTRPIEFKRTWVIGKPGEGLTEYACSENNIDAANLGPGPGPIGTDGNRGAGYGVLPKNPPGPEAYGQ